MKKIIFLVFLVLTMLLASTCGAYAAAPAAQAQIATVIVDGNITKLNPMPQIVNKEVYFPLGSALKVMGVTANNKNVIVGKANSGITIINGKNKLIAKTNGKSVTVNGKAVQLKSTVINQKNTIYIPAELIYKFTGKKVLYSANDKAVSVIDEKALKSLKEFFTTVDTASAAITDCKTKMTMTMDMNMTGFGNIKVNAASNGEMDKTNNIIHTVFTSKTDMLGQTQEISTETYTVQGKTYVKDPTSGNWVTAAQSEDLSTDLISGLLGDSKGEDIDAASEELIASSYKIVTDKREKSITVKNGFLAKIALSDTLKEAFGGKEPSSVDLSFTLDNETKLINSITMSASGDVLIEGVKTKITMKIEVSLSDYNKGLKIQLPEGLN
jgi:hypothetical protein